MTYLHSVTDGLHYDAQTEDYGVVFQAGGKRRY